MSIYKRIPWLVWPGLILVIVTATAINITAARYHLKKDLTADSYFSLAPKTLDVIEAVERKKLHITLYVLISPLNTAYSDTRMLLEQYAAASDQINVKYMDQDRDPAGTKALLDKLKIRDNNVIVFECGERRRFVPSTGLYEWSKRSPLDQKPAKVIGFRGEEVITSGIMSVSEDRPKVAYTVTGHDERNLMSNGTDGGSAFAQAILRSHFAIKQIATQNANAIPADCDLLIINRPRTIFSRREMTTIDNYLKDGGSLLLLLDAPLEIRPLEKANFMLRKYFAEWNITINNNLIIDPDQTLAGFGAGTLSAHTFGTHPVIRRMGEASLIFSNSRSIDLPNNETADVATKEKLKRMAWTPLVRSSPSSWGETNLLQLQDIAKDDKDVSGAQNLAIAVERGFVAEDGTQNIARVFIIGSSIISTNQQSVGFDHQPNADFLTNAINFLTGREEIAGIGPRKPEHVRIKLSTSEMRWIMLLVLIILPLVVAGVGLSIYSIRRTARRRT